MDLLVCWKWGLGRYCATVIWGAIPLCLMWTILREQNQGTFEAVELSNVELKSIFLISLYEWMVALSDHSFSSLDEFLDLCTFW